MKCMSLKFKPWTDSVLLSVTWRGVLEQKTTISCFVGRYLSITSWVRLRMNQLVQWFNSLALFSPSLHVASSAAGCLDANMGSSWYFLNSKIKNMEAWFICNFQWIVRHEMNKKTLKNRWLTSTCSINFNLFFQVVKSHNITFWS